MKIPIADSCRRPAHWSATVWDCNLPAARFPTLIGRVIVITGPRRAFRNRESLGASIVPGLMIAEPAEVDWVPGAFCIIRPAALVRTGLFDPVFFLYCEEVDLCFRIKRSGYNICYWPDVSVIHIEASLLINSTSKLLPLACTFFYGGCVVL